MNVGQHDLKLRHLVDQCRNLPTVPGVAMKLLEEFRAREISLKSTANTISQDPALTAKVLGFVNSPFFGVRREVTSITHAIALLGLTSVRSLALSFSLVRGLRKTDHAGFDYAHFWERSIISAATARAIARHVRLNREADLLFLTGLIHEIGMLVIQQVIPDIYVNLHRKAGRDHRLLVELEQFYLGTDHHEVTLWLADIWQLPQIITNLLQEADQEPDEEEEDFLPECRQCISFTRLFVDAWYSPNDESEAWYLVRHEVETDTLNAVIEAVKDSIPMLSSLFEIQIGDSEVATKILLEAHDQLGELSFETVRQKRQVELLAQRLSEENRELKDASLRDNLTGLYNRAFLDSVLHERFQRSSSLKQPTSVVFLDIDHFKRINDTFSHQTGDEVLVHISKLLKDELRQSDQPVRFGGDEFVIFLPNTDGTAATVIADRLRSVISEKPYQLGPDNIPVTVSIGLATHSEDEPFETLQELWDAADRALLESKRNGRNQLRPYVNGSTITRVTL